MGSYVFVLNIELGGVYNYNTAIDTILHNKFHNSGWLVGKKEKEKKVMDT